MVRISEAPTVYLPTGQGGKLVVTGFPDRFRRFGPDGRALLEDTAARWGVAQRQVSGELYPLFLANQRRGLRSGYDAGDLSPYAALLLGAGLYDRMFERRTCRCAGRMRSACSSTGRPACSSRGPAPRPGSRRGRWPPPPWGRGPWPTCATSCRSSSRWRCSTGPSPPADDDSERSFSTRRVAATGGLRRRQGGAADRLTRTVNHYLVKSFDARWRSSQDVMAGLFYTAAMPAAAARVARQEPELAPPVSMFDKASNVDEFNVAYAATRLANRRAATRILVVLADGMTRGSVEALAASVDAVEHAGATVLGIGIGDTTVQAAYARNQVVETPDELARAMVDGVRSTLAPHADDHGRYHVVVGPDRTHSRLTRGADHMAETVTFTDPSGDGKPVELETVEIPTDLPDHDARMEHIPDPDPFYVDLGMLYRLPSWNRSVASTSTTARCTWRCAATWGPARTTTWSSSPPCSASPTTGSR